jgi:hypothetical protein
MEDPVRDINGPGRRDDGKGEMAQAATGRPNAYRDRRVSG